MFKRFTVTMGMLVLCLVSGLVSASNANSVVGYWATYDHNNNDAKNQNSSLLFQLLETMNMGDDPNKATTWHRMGWFIITSCN